MASRRPSGSGRSREARASSRGGSTPGNRSASMVLPEPGGPDRRRWWPPAAATSTARRPKRLAPYVGEVQRPAMAPSARDTSLRRVRPSHGWAAVAARTTQILARRPGPTGLRRARGANVPCARPAAATSAASATDDGGTTTVGEARASTSGRVPGTERIVPSRPSSPTNPQPATAAGSSSPVATSRPTAIGRSEPGAGLAHAGGGEVHSHAPERPGEAAREQGGTDPVTRLPTGGVRQARRRRSPAGRWRREPRRARVGPGRRARWRMGWRRSRAGSRQNCRLSLERPLTVRSIANRNSGYSRAMSAPGRVSSPVRLFAVDLGRSPWRWEEADDAKLVPSREMTGVDGAAAPAEPAVPPGL